MTTPMTLVPVAHDVAVFRPWHEFDKMLEFAQHIFSTGFCPNGVTKPVQVVAILQTGRELGIPPMQALRHIVVIQGRPTMSAELMMALMLRAGVQFEWLADSATVATLKATRPGTTYTGTFSLEDARLAGLLTKPGGGWQKYPRAMLRARVVSLVGRVVAPDVIMGFHTPEEMGADTNADGEVVGALPAGPAVPAADDPVAAALGLTTSPFEVGTWLTAFDGATAAGEVASLWKGLSQVFTGTWMGFTPDQQEAIVQARERAKARLAPASVGG